MAASDKLQLTVWWRSPLLGGSLWKHELRLVPTPRMRLLHRIAARLRPTMIGSRMRRRAHDFVMAAYCSAVRKVLLETPTVVEEERRDADGVLVWGLLDASAGAEVARHLTRDRLTSIRGVYAGSADRSFIDWSCSYPCAA